MGYKELIKRLRACAFTVIDTQLVLWAANFIEAQQAALAGQTKYVETLEHQLATVEAVHGRWKPVYTCSGERLWGYNCNRCKLDSPTQSKYCPNCGAKMDGRVEG